MGRILALDYGRKRVGVAMTDSLQISANAIDTIATKDLFEFLKSLFSKEEIDVVVVGNPKQMNNTDSEAVVYVKEFTKRFKNEFPEMKVVLIDERFTSKLAFNTMIESGISRKRRQDKALVDKISATIILQSYLEMKDNRIID